MKCDFHISALNFVTIAVMLLLGSCAQSMVYSDDEPDVMSGIVLRLPNVEMAQDGNVGKFTGANSSASEGTLNNLYFVSVPRDNKNSFNIISLTDSFSSSDGYSEYKIALSPGSYKFYVLANLDNYLSDEATPTTLLERVKSESDLQNLILEFSPSCPITADCLPMLCLPSEIRLNGQKQEIISLSRNATYTIEAQMDFLCSKVRYTILFDNEGVSKSFGSSGIEFLSDNLSPYADNIRRSTPLIYTNDTGSLDFFEGQWYLALGRYEFPEQGVYYPKNQSDQLVEWVEDATHIWEKSGKRAWQGVTYLPENKSADKPTNLNFLYCIDNGEIESQPKTITLYNPIRNEGLERGKMYDYVAIVKGNDNIEINVGVSDWVVQTLDYDLQDPAPSELILETTSVEIDENGTSQEVWFISDSEVSAESCKIDDMDLFEIYITSHVYGNKGSFIVTLNPDISPSQLNSLSEDCFIYLVAGSLKKRIDITIRGSGEYLVIMPDEITIDLRQYFERDISEVSRDISFRTNLTALGLNLSADTNGFPLNNDFIQLFKGNYDSNLELIIAEQNIAIAPAYSFDCKKGIVRIVLSGINDDEELWQDNHDYILVFEGTGTEKDLKRELKIHIISHG